jgi:transposase
VFVSVLGASGYLYAEAMRGQDSQSWLDVHVRTFEFYGAVPEVVVPDCLKAGVNDPCWYDPEVNPSYLDLARHYDVAVLPTQAPAPARQTRSPNAGLGAHAASCSITC